ncbi:hypothetical protein L0Y49_00395, partial [bacterium]|nr:hypothetical protein [bacterium]
MIEFGVLIFILGLLTFLGGVNHKDFSAQAANWFGDGVAGFISNNFKGLRHVGIVMMGLAALGV